MHAGAWLVWGLCAGLVALLTSNPFYLVPLFAVAWVVYAAHRTDGPGNRSFFVFFGFGLAAMATRTALVLFGPVTRAGVLLAALEGLRLAALLTVFGTLNSVADPYRILRLAPRRMHEPALAAALALSLAPRYVEAVAQVREAQRLRGMEVRGWRALPALTVPVLETGMEEALTLAESMDARGHGRGPRSRYRPERLGAASVAVVSVSLAALVVFATAHGEPAALAVDSFPSTWPTVSWTRLAAVLALALPAALPRRSR